MAVPRQQGQRVCAGATYLHVNLERERPSLEAAIRGLVRDSRLERFSPLFSELHTDCDKEDTLYCEL
jgi:hypothetical protein